MDNIDAILCNLPPADINECVTESPCHASASCTNTLGSFTCACNPGYSGDGTTCHGGYPSMVFTIQHGVLVLSSNPVLAV